ncbi:nucleotidyltransferase domain-containing protein [Geotalea toluenoxydans]|uniref:nucleotidyltransferase domain-containing protein n=1 Tax=Geotalea toluenoxydans TaxID=421624 RepID=UPI0006D23DD7|nr:nucleotidyltransferase domain-containing protein [Geotalea toluenoxydans]
MADQGIAETLFGAYRRRALTLLLLRPDKSFYVREISRLSSIPAGSLHRELKTLAQAGFLLRESVGNQVRYQANRDCPIYEELASIFRKTSGLADVLRDALLPLGNAAEVAFIFGSVAQGKETAASDVDLFIIGSASFVSVVQALSKVHERLGREVNPVVVTVDDLRKRLREKDHFLQTILDKPKIFVVGDVHDLGQFAENRAAKAARNK